MVEDARPPEGSSPQGERRKTTIIREGPPRREVLEAMEEQAAPARVEPVEKAVATGTLAEGLAGTCAAILWTSDVTGTIYIGVSTQGRLGIDPYYVLARER